MDSGKLYSFAFKWQILFTIISPIIVLLDWFWGYGEWMWILWLNWAVILISPTLFWLISDKKILRKEWNDRLLNNLFNTKDYRAGGKVIIFTLLLLNLFCLLYWYSTRFLV